MLNIGQPCYYPRMYIVQCTYARLLAHSRALRRYRDDDYEAGYSDRL